MSGGELASSRAVRSVCPPCAISLGMNFQSVASGGISPLGVLQEQHTQDDEPGGFQD
jgi:hypothetical protein